MKPIYKAAAVAALALATAALFTGCQPQKTPYDTNNTNGYTVSIKYDANGGLFTTNTAVIMDSFNVSDMTTNSQGKAEIALLSPDDENRGAANLTTTKAGHFLVGWYRERHESTDENGNVTYTYGGRWDFGTDRVEVDPTGTYSAEEPYMTLYAAWAPTFNVDVYSLENPAEKVGSVTMNPNQKTELRIPAWNTETGEMDLFDFPENEGYTFNKAYLDAEGKQEVKTETLAHTGTIDYDNGTVENTTMNVYIDWTEGEWYRIYTAEQFVENIGLKKNFELCADLDFTDEIWPTSLMHGNFEGQIRGNGHTIKNVNLRQTNNNKANAGLFGQLTDKAVLTDVTFENVCVTLEKGTRMNDASFGLLAGRLSDDAELTKVSILNSTLQIDSDCYFGNVEYVIGLVCGMGDPKAVDKAQITCKAVGDDPDAVKIKIDGNSVTLGD